MKTTLTNALPLARRIADQLEASAERLRQEPVHPRDLEAVRQQLAGEVRLLELLLARGR